MGWVTGWGLFRAPCWDKNHFDDKARSTYVTNNWSVVWANKSGGGLMELMVDCCWQIPWQGGKRVIGGELILGEKKLYEHKIHKLLQLPNITMKWFCPTNSIFFTYWWRQTWRWNVKMRNVNIHDGQSTLSTPQLPAKHLKGRIGSLSVFPHTFWFRVFKPGRTKGANGEVNARVQQLKAV